jgi:hypothetical protein
VHPNYGQAFLVQAIIPAGVANCFVVTEDDAAFSELGEYRVGTVNLRQVGGTLWLRQFPEMS